MGLLDWVKDVFGNETQPEDPMRLCNSCGFEFPEMSLVSEGTLAFCPECNGKRKKEKADIEFKKKQALANVKIKYYCYNCKFHFSRKKDFSVRMCPNCGAENFVEENKMI